MEYFSKFRRSWAPQRPTTTLRASPEQMLEKFEKCWKYVHRDCFLETRKPSDVVHMSDFPSCLRTMVDILMLEQNSFHATSPSTGELGPTGPCLEYLLKNNVLSVLVDVSGPDIPLGLRGEAIRTMSSIVQLLDDRVLAHAPVHAPVLRLLKVTVSDRTHSERYQDDLVDLMYNICAVISRYPPLLNIFFHDKAWLRNEVLSPTSPTGAEGPSMTLEKSNGSAPRMETSAEELHSPRWEFLLWEYLLRFVHLQGRSGDLARTGLLYLVELADEPVQDYILTQSDFPVTVAAALGALYSQLPRQVSIPSLPAGYPVAAPRPSSGAGGGPVEVTSATYREPVAALLNLLDFCEDALSRCPSSAVTGAVLRKVRSVFLENVVATSLTEANETDGSATAVCLYLEAMLASLRAAAEAGAGVARLVVDFLLGNMVPEPPLSAPILTNPDGGVVDVDDRSGRVPPFSVTEFIIRWIHSDQTAVAVAALRLLRTLLYRHCLPAYSLLNHAPSIVDIASPPDSAKMASYLDHEADTATCLSALGSVEPDCVAELLDNYCSYLQDAEAEITRHCATPGHHTPAPASFLQRDTSPRDPPRSSGEPALDAVWTSCLRISDDGSVRSGPGYQDFVPLHDAAANGPLLQGLFVEVGRFFARPPEVNLELIGVLSTLALCPCRSLRGWLTLSPSTSTPKLRTCDSGLGVEELSGEGPAWGCNEDEEDYLETLLDGGAPSAAGPPPRIFASLCALAKNVERHRSDLEETQPGNFAKALRRRRKDLLSPPPGSGSEPSLLFDPHRRGSCPSSHSTEPPRRTSWVPFRSPPASPPQAHRAGDAEKPVSAPSTEFPTPAAPPERFLDNVVILQEAVKELMAIVQVRRAIPVEGIRYV